MFPLCVQVTWRASFVNYLFPNSVNQSVNPFEILHSDHWGPFPCISVDSYRYYVTFIDDYTRYCWIFPLVKKSDVFPTFVAFYNYVLNFFSTRIKILQSDGGGKYISKNFQSFLADKGISHHKSCPHTPEQNGLAERKHRYIIETTVTLLQTTKLPSKFWSYACQTATYLSIGCQHQYRTINHLL